jgi:hypothetical protein
MNTILKIRKYWNAHPAANPVNAGLSADTKFAKMRRQERSVAEHPAFPYGLDIGRVSS